jgi:hypothetical protein
MSYETYVLSVDGAPVGAYSELSRAASEAESREQGDTETPVSLQWDNWSVSSGDVDHWESGRYVINRFDTNTGDGNPFTGDIVIQINDIPGGGEYSALSACSGAVAEIFGLLGAVDFQEVQFLFIVEDHPAIIVSGPRAVTDRVMDYATLKYPRLGAEWCQI